LFTSELKLKLYDGPEIDKGHLVGSTKFNLQALETKLRESYAVELKDMKKSGIAASVKLNVEFRPDIILEDRDFIPEKISGDLEDQDPIGNLSVYGSC
jgi:Ca2+-dependent lipid-binding protein